MPASKDLLEKVNGMFLRYGVKSVTMDEIASSLGVSKKTLYVHFPNKAGMVKQTTQWLLDLQKDKINEIVQKDLNAIEELYQIYEMNFIQFQELHPSVIFDLKKYFQESWSCFLNHKDSFIFNQICMNLTKGVEEGLFREDIDISIIAKFYIARIDTILDPEIFHPVQFPFPKILHEAFIYHVRGIATEKGLNILKSLDLKF